MITYLLLNQCIEFIKQQMFLWKTFVHFPIFKGFSKTIMALTDKEKYLAIKNVTINKYFKSRCILCERVEKNDTQIM